MSAAEKLEFSVVEISYLEAKTAKMTLMRRLEQVKQDIGKAHLQVLLAGAKLNAIQTQKCDVYLMKNGGVSDE